MEEEKIKQEEVTEETLEQTATKNSEEILDDKSPKKKIKEKKKKIDKEKDELVKANLDLKEKVLRITAEMQNMRRRYDVDMANMYKYEGFDLVEKLLPVIDNFERAMSVKTEGSEKFLEGFKMIYDNLVDILKSKGIVEVEAKDKIFNPTIMNAVLTEVNNSVEDNTVLEVLQKGYMYNDKLIRPAMVKVSEKGNDEAK